MNKFFWLDVETTGTDPEIHLTHQISGYIEIGGKIVDIFDYKIRLPEGFTYTQEALDCGEVPLTIEELTSPNRMDPKDVYNDLVGRLGKYCQKFNKKDKYTLIGYNVTFDKNFLNSFFLQNDDKYLFSWIWGNTIDVMSKATEYLLFKRPEMVNFKLMTVCEFLGIKLDSNKLHKSDYDIEITRILYYTLCKLIMENYQSRAIADDPRLSEYLTKTSEDVKNMPLPADMRVNLEPIGYGDILWFGKKHYGKTVDDIMEADPGYFIWMRENVNNHPLFEEEIYDDAQRILDTEKKFSSDRGRRTPKYGGYTTNAIDDLFDNATRGDYF